MARTGRSASRVATAVAVSALVAVTAAACSKSSSSSGSSSGGDTITIGAYAGATGGLQAYGLDEKHGWEIAEAEINAAGGINGKKLSIDFHDDASDATQARSIMSKFVSDKNVIGVMGPTSTANALASQPLAVKAHLPVVSVSNSGNNIVSQGPEIFRIFVPDPAILKPLVEQAVKDLSIKNAAVMYAQDDPFSLDSYNGFKSALAANNVSVGATVAYSKGNPDLGPQIRQLQNAHPDAVFVAAYSQDAGAFIKRARAAGLNVPIIGNQSFNSPGQLEVAGSNFGTVLVGSQWFAGATDQRSQTFVKTFEQKYGSTPGEFAAMAYNGAFVIKAALEASKDNSQAGLLKGLTGLSGYQALGSPVTFTNRDATTTQPLVLQVKDGKFVLYNGPNS